MFEHRSSPVISRRAFIGRLLWNFLLSSVFIIFALLVGTTGYHWICNLSWIDAFYNSSMILTGMGPAAPMTTDSGKIFASLYALFSGIIFLGTITIVLAPVIHRLLHRFHVKYDD